MSVTIRLMRFGKKKSPFYRIVALDKRKKRDGAYIEKIGTYNPFLKENAVEILKEKFEYWTVRGAQLSEGMQKLMKQSKNVLFK